jgi:hypothetical protein
MSNKQIQTMTQAQFATRHHVSRRTVNIWRAAGLVLLADNGKIAVALSDARLAWRPRFYRGGRARGPALEVADVTDTMPPLGELPVLPRFRFP